MSKETIEKIKAAEQEADRLIAQAETLAAQMKSEAATAGKARCEAAEKEVEKMLSKALSDARKRAETQTAETLKQADAEANEIAKRAESGRVAAEAIVIGGVEAKCR